VTETDLPHLAPAPERTRVAVPEDPRDLAGDFPHRFPVLVRFGDTDAMGHTNNSRFLTYCESARIDYWEQATGEPLAVVTHGADETLILAEIRVTFRSPSYFGEPLVVETRLGRLGRTSFTMEHRITAPDSPRGAARLIATAEGVQVLYDYASKRPQPLPDAIVARLEAFEGRPLRPTGG
jgi:acyl-CoA thioester hydrolase